MLIDLLLKFPTKNNLLTQKGGKVWHQHLQHLHLAAWKLLSGTSLGHLREAVVIAFGARWPSTMWTYDSQLSRFRVWSSERSNGPLEAPAEAVADLLPHMFRKGKQVSTIRNYWSAISSVYKSFTDGSTISCYEAICHILRGLFNKKPPWRRPTPAWTNNDVLLSLASPPYELIHNTSLELLTRKTLFLVAAAPAWRSKLNAPTTKNAFIPFSHDGVPSWTLPSLLRMRSHPLPRRDLPAKYCLVFLY